jgi:glutamyl-tRNA(Gln) amidotransferase subunit D
LEHMPPTEVKTKTRDDERQGYRGASLELLRRFNAKVGQRIKVETRDGLVSTGLLLPRYEHADSEHVVLKLKSGYNLGLEAEKVVSISILEEASPQVATPLQSRIPREGKKRLLLLSTGGTIASRVDYRTGAVHPALSASDLYTAVPELDEIASVEPQVVFSVYSENMGPKEWQALSERILQASRSERPDGIVVMIGTDTLAYVAAALSFSLIGITLPVVFVGAQRSSDRPSSDAALNLQAAARFAVYSKSPGVYVAMHNSENDDSIAIHSAVRVRKNHTSRRDAFRSIDVPLIAHVRGDQIIPISQPTVPGKGKEEFELKTRFDERVALLKFYPGFDSTILDYLATERKVRGVIIEGSGLGHVSSRTVEKIAELVRRGIFVGMASQCIWGHVDMNVYDTGRDLLDAGVVSLENMLAETAFVKLSWAVANFGNVSEVMRRNMAGEMTTRIPLY